MAERKVISKHIPSDFDPSLLPKISKPKNAQVKIRTMLPMSIRCTECGEYMGQGKKFNSRKETVEGETYLGLKVFRFYIRCTRCASELTFKTEPKNSTYVAERNCVRNYTPWSNTTQEDEEKEELIKQQEEYDSMKQLEKRTLEMRQEMEALDELDELRTISAQNQKVSIDDLLEKNKSAQMKERSEDALLTEEDLRAISDFANSVPSSTDTISEVNAEKDNLVINFKKRKLDSITEDENKQDNGGLFADSSVVVLKDSNKKAKKKKKKSLSSSLASLVSSYE